MIKSGTATNAPAGPHSQVQNINDKNTVRGLSARRRPMMLGVIKCPSSVVKPKNSSGAMSACVKAGKGHQSDSKQDQLHYQCTDIRNEIKNDVSTPLVMGFGNPTK